MGTTNVYGWRYAEVGDPPNGPLELQQAVEDIEATVSGLETGGLPVEAIDWTDVPLAGAATINTDLNHRVRRLATGEVELEFGASWDAGTDAVNNGQSVGVLPSWARPLSKERRYKCAHTATSLVTNTHLDLRPDGDLWLSSAHDGAAGVTWFQLCCVYTP